MSIMGHQEAIQSMYFYVADYKELRIKTRLCEYLKEEYSADVDESRIVLLPSGNATYDLVCHCLFDSDDVILTNAPTYSRNFVNVSERAQCLLAPVNVRVVSLFIKHHYSLICPTLASILPILRKFMRNELIRYYSFLLCHASLREKT